MGQVGSVKSTDEVLKENSQQLRKAIRELDREKRKLEVQEKKVGNDIKKAAKQNQMSSVKIMAKDLVRTKKYVQKFTQMRAQLQAVSLRMQTMKSTEAMTRAMKGATVAMTRMNRQLNIPSLQKIMRQFSMESERMDMTEEMMTDAIDDVMEDEDDEEEEEAIVSQVLDELGIQMMDDIPEVGGVRTTAVAAPVAEGKVPMAVATAGGGGGDSSLNDLESRLNNLRK